MSTLSFAGDAKGRVGGSISWEIGYGAALWCRSSRESRYAQSNASGDVMAIIEDEPKPMPAPVPLDRMGVDELERYVAGLRAEIARAETYIAAKQTHRSAADDLFKF